jgi:hypothetical protein
VSAPLTDFLAQEYEYVRERVGGDFFLALAGYVNALDGKAEIGKILTALKAETQEALNRFIDEQNALIEDAKAIRTELAARVPEIDNSDLTPPDDVASEEWMSYDLDSFARFDELANNDLAVAYPSLPDDTPDPGPLSRLLGILRGRLHAAEYGEDGSINDPKIRDDLGDTGRRIGNLARRHEHSLGRYRQDGRTLPGLAFGRLVYYGSDLVPEPTIIETEEDAVHAIERFMRAYGSPKRSVQKLVNGERLEEWERRSVSETEAKLKSEAERLHRELMRRLSETQREDSSGAPVEAPEQPKAPSVLREHVAAFVVAVLALIVGTLILVYVFGIGNGDSTALAPTSTGRTSEEPPPAPPATATGTRVTTGTETKSISEDDSQAFFGGEVLISVIGISFEGEPLRHRVTARVAESPGTRSIMFRNEEVGALRRFVRRYEIRVRSIDTSDATFSVTKLAVD